MPIGVLSSYLINSDAVGKETVYLSGNDKNIVKLFI